MNSHGNFQNSSLIRYSVSNKNVKSKFLSSEPLLNDFSKILFYGNKVSHGTTLYIEFHDRRQNGLGREES